MTLLVRYIRDRQARILSRRRTEVAVFLTYFTQQVRLHCNNVPHNYPFLFSEAFIFLRGRQTCNAHKNEHRRSMTHTLTRIIHHVRMQASTQHTYTQLPQSKVKSPIGRRKPSHRHEVLSPVINKSSGNNIKVTETRRLRKLSVLIRSVPSGGQKLQTISFTKPVDAKCVHLQI